jgi:hypothetical protein
MADMLLFQQIEARDQIPLPIPLPMSQNWLLTGRSDIAKPLESRSVSAPVRCRSGQKNFPLLSGNRVVGLVAEEGQDQRAGVRCGAMLEKEDTLPDTELYPPVCHRNR